MDNFTKDTLICMIEDLTNNINILKQNNIQLILEENTKLKEEIDNLNSRFDQLKSYNKKQTSKYKEKHEELIAKLESCKKGIEKLKDEISLKDKENREILEREALSASWEHKFIEQQEENQKLKRELNILKFLSTHCIWTDEYKEVWNSEGLFKVAPSSTKDIHKRMVQWAKENGIPNTGKHKGIPTEESLKEYIVERHKKKFPNRWEISEVNEYPKYYNGSKKTPRVNLKIK